MKKKATTKKATKPTATKAKPQGKKAKKLSQIDAAIKVLAEAKEPMNCKAMIKAMQAKGYWKSPIRVQKAQLMRSSQGAIGCRTMR